MNQRIGFSVWGEGYTHGMQEGSFDTGKESNCLLYISMKTHLCPKSNDLAPTPRPNMFP